MQQKWSELDTDLKPFTNINLKCIIGLYINQKNIKHLEDSIEENLDDPRYGNYFRYNTKQIIYERNFIDNLYFIKIRNFCFVKDNNKIMKRQATDWGRGFAKYISDKKCFPKCKKVLKTLQ